MTTDLWTLVGAAILHLAIVFLYSSGRFATPGGFVWAFGNRDAPLEVAPWVDRAVRAQQNLTESLGPFAVLVLVATAAGRASETSALGATIFLGARVVHAALYIGGIRYLRSFAWAAALAGQGLILAAIVRGPAGHR